MFLVECLADETMMKSITSNQKIVHIGGKSRIINLLTKRESRYHNNKGIIDEDPNSSQPRRLKRFIEKSNYPEYGIIVLYYPVKNNYLIVIQPTLEAWILKAVSEAKINIENYNLPKSVKHLHLKINTRLHNFKRLLSDLSKQNNNRVYRLMNLLNNFDTIFS